ncbi:hypothetical protein PGT21_009347 [Puccinia graminis f. sp. tritici]|uniref:Uncharacterized protein n=1 Tax=Puccinia graminis f. sp. tritici TaxID=56615 RepID=A0A5B0NX25_PUCGR|nr:hypothetical protein PGT21_009331 [Puccinia graminis f. sp. tritici]KAA1092640.1 hypothetical protein PGT21_009347 [Puccinia graminis f. sp. tritici]KAA1093738.1 hypothetical protein PGTUg99_024927 [Puccinia graminis f. sp. tritici]KAA1093739.1 hypothetical protein PGTUg99_024975 [Puccinia graminis f. sp. tritici]
MHTFRLKTWFSLLPMVYLFLVTVINAMVVDPAMAKMAKENLLEIPSTEPFMMRTDPDINSQEWYCDECRKNHDPKAGCSK